MYMIYDRCNVVGTDDMIIKPLLLDCALGVEPFIHAIFIKVFIVIQPLSIIMSESYISHFPNKFYADLIPRCHT